MPSTGDIWWDYQRNSIWVHDGVRWVDAGPINDNETRKRATDLAHKFRLDHPRQAGAPAPEHYGSW